MEKKKIHSYLVHEAALLLRSMNENEREKTWDTCTSKAESKAEKHINEAQELFPAQSLGHTWAMGINRALTAWHPIAH